VATFVPGKVLKEKQDKVAELCCVLSPASDNNNDTITLGFTLTSEILVEGTTVKALLNTASPVTILSLNFIVNH